MCVIKIRCKILISFCLGMWLNDIALVKLSEEVPSQADYIEEIQEIHLAQHSSFPANNQNCTMKGWGCKKASRSCRVFLKYFFCFITSIENQFLAFLEFKRKIPIATFTRSRRKTVLSLPSNFTWSFQSNVRSHHKVFLLPRYIHVYMYIHLTM